MRVTVRVVGALQVATLVVCCVAFSKAPVLLLLCYVVGGLVSFVIYRVDKQAAIKGAWRVSEGTLHFVDLLLFGVIGGLMAQATLRHKTSKVSFAVTTGFIVAIHVAALLLVLLGYWPHDLVRGLLGA